MRAELREATTPADLHSVAILVGRWAAELGSATDPAFPARFVAEWPRTHTRAWLTSEDGRDVGFASAVQAESLPWPGVPDRRWWHLNGLYVRSEHRRRGHASALLAAVRATAQISGIQRVTVTADDDARARYLAAGFIPQPRAMVLRP